MPAYIRRSPSDRKALQVIARICRELNLRPPKTEVRFEEVDTEIANNSAIAYAIAASSRFSSKRKLQLIWLLAGTFNKNLKQYQTEKRRVDQGRDVG